MSRALTRRDFLALSEVAAGASVLAGCSFFSTSSGKQKTQNHASSAGNPKEAPALAAQVKSGSLPPINKRLPENPIVIKPIHGIGKYGGTWRTGDVSQDNSWWYETVTYGGHLVKWDRHWKQVVPHLAESFKVNADSTEYTFTLRKGTKWSDGSAFTVDDIAFWRDAFYANKELTPVIDERYGDNGQPVVIQKLDDYTFKFVFHEPHGMFLQDLASWQPALRPLPGRYLKQFHKSYNRNISAEVKKSKLSDWTELFLEKIDPLNNPDLPSLNAWLPTKPWSSGGVQTWRRNPYYPAVDSAGSQLPYLDEVSFQFYNNEQPMLLAAEHGDIDLYMRAEVTIPTNKPVLAQSEQTGAYKLIDVTDGRHNQMGICFNLTHKDPVKRKIYQNKQFRIGLSYAINRKEIINVVYERQGEPRQTAPRPEAPFYDQTLATQYTDYDLDQANRYLDQAGFSKRNAGGKRLGPDGKPIIVTVLTQTRYPTYVDALQLIKGTWAKVGIEMQIDNVDSTLAGNRITANNFECTVDSGELGYLDMIQYPRWLFASTGSSYAPLWSNWFLGMTPKEEPPAQMKQQMEIWNNEVFQTSDLNAQIEGMKKIVAIAREEFWSMGIVLPTGTFAILRNRMRNVPGDNEMWLAFTAPYPAVADPEQFYIED
jgi:peptide/nickel transport system substrate-binding protein